MFDHLPSNDAHTAALAAAAAAQAAQEGQALSIDGWLDERLSGETVRDTGDSAGAKAVFTLWAYMNPEVVTSEIARPSTGH